MNDHDHWYKIRVFCQPGYEEVVTGHLFSAGFSGFQEEFDTVEGITVFTVYSSDNKELKRSTSVLVELLKKLTDSDGNLCAAVSETEIIPNEDWEFNWRKGLDAVEVGTDFVVRPSWIPYDNTTGRNEIIIDPKMAFGTGGHATTRLCMESLERYDMQGAHFLDIGCGSGILMIQAAILGAQIVDGFDIDEISVENAQENLILNNVADKAHVFTADVSSAAEKKKMNNGHYGIVAANMLSGIIIENFESIMRFVSPVGGRVLFSGILDSERDMMSHVFEKNGLYIENIRQCEEWLVFETRKES